MDTPSHSLMCQFCHVVSLASLAYIFSGIHALQYSLNQLDYDTMDDNHADNQLEENAPSTSHLDLTQAGASTPSHDTSYPVDAGNLKASANGCWTDQEITLLLDYVEANCSLSRGLNLKKSQFNKACDTVKSKGGMLQNATTNGTMYIFLYSTKKAAN